MCFYNRGSVIKKNYKHSGPGLFTHCFTPPKDPRRINKGNIRHSLNEVLFVSISAVICGCVGLESIQLFGEQQLDWLRRFFPYKRGAPSHDTLGRVFANLDVIEFNKCFISWVDSISDLCHGRVIALDGKTIYGAASTAA